MTTETVTPDTLTGISDRYREIAHAPDPSSSGVAWDLSRWLLVSALRANALSDMQALAGEGLSTDTMDALRGNFAAVHLLEAVRRTVRTGEPVAPTSVAAQIADACYGEFGEWLWEHSRHLGIDINEVTRLAEAEARLKATPAVRVKHGPDCGCTPCKAEPSYEARRG